MKKLLLFFMITLLPVLGNTQTLIDGIYYNLNSSDNTASVTNNSNGYYSGRIVIPEKVIYGGATYSVTSIGEYAFSGCASLTGIIIPNSVTTIGEMAFYNCSSLMDIIIPNSVTTIEDRAFKGCPSLNSVTIGTGVKKIGRYIFDGGAPAKVFWLPNTPPTSWWLFADGRVNYVSNSQYAQYRQANTKVYEFLSSMFEVDGVKYVPVSPSERTCDAIDYVYDMPVSEVSINTTVSYQGIDMKVLNVQPYSFYQNLNLKNAVLDIPGNISEYAFCGCTNLQTTILGSSITGIGEYAFSGCTNMTSAIVGDGTKTIGAHAFSDCTSLTSATIGDSIRFFQQYAFSGCSLLQTITIPGSVRLIEDYTFYDCKSLKEIMVKAKNNTDRRTTYFDPIYVQRGQSETVTIYVAKGEELSFDYDSYMGSVTVSFLGEDIPINGFFFRHIFNKDGKVSITLKSSNATNYYSYSKITNVKLIESGSLLLGSNGNSPIFADCPLETVFIDRDLAYRSENNSGYSPFYNNKFLRSIVITNNGEEISDNEFYGCTNLQNVQIGDGVTSIGNWAFSGCSSLKSFSFGTNVSNIGKEAFSDCTAMTELISHATIPPTCGSQALDDINKWTCKLFVPKGCVGAYQAASQWKEFFFIEEDEKQKAEIAINEENFPDENFRAYLMSQSYGKDGIITEEEIKNVVQISVGKKNITNLKGIEYFTALTYLSCYENQLTSLDVSKNTTLARLVCNNNQLTSLDVSKNTALTELYCYDNKIKGEAMDALVGSLPNQIDATLRVIDLSNSSEENVCTTIQVNVAKEKGWKVLKSNGAEYKGSDPSGIQGITLDKNVNTSIYDLNGRKLKKPGKGINIIDGKKVLKH